MKLDGYLELKKAAEDFVDKVETGRAKSVDSYRKFKHALLLIKENKNNEHSIA